MVERDTLCIVVLYVCFFGEGRSYHRLSLYRENICLELDGYEALRPRSIRPVKEWRVTDKYYLILMKYELILNVSSREIIKLSPLT